MWPASATPQEFESAKEEIKNKNSEEYNVLRFTLEGLIEELERHFDDAHANYTSTTEQRTFDFKNLTLKDQQSAKTIESQMRRLQRLHDSTTHWKAKIASNAAECEQRNRALKEEKDSIARHFQVWRAFPLRRSPGPGPGPGPLPIYTDADLPFLQELKARMNRFRDAEGRRLMELTINSQASIKTLKEKLEKAERILKLAEVTRKLETEREKVLPFYESSVAEEEKAASGAAEVVKSLQTSAAGRDGQAVEEWDYLSNFFKRYNKVLLDATAIERERERLAAENGDLRSILKQYLDGISVNEDVLNAPNPLLVVNNRSNVVGNATRRLPVATVAIEAAHVVQMSTVGRQGASI
mgnify:CR=1 FL=1